MTPKKLKKLELIIIIACAALVGIPLLLWLFQQIPYIWVEIAILLAGFIIFIFVIFLQDQYKKTQKEDVKKTSSHWKSILILDIIYNIIWWIF